MIYCGRENLLQCHYAMNENVMYLKNSLKYLFHFNFISRNVTWSFRVEISLSPRPASPNVLVESLEYKGSPPTTSRIKYCESPPSFPATQTTSRTVSLRISQALGASGGSVGKHFYYLFAWEMNKVFLRHTYLLAVCAPNRALFDAPLYCWPNRPMLSTLSQFEANRWLC